MSGGSFDYLCHSYSLLSALENGQMRAMADALLEYPGGRAAALETLKIIQAFDRIEAAWDASMDAGLREAWKAVEWHHSADWSRDQVIEALRAFNGLPPQEESK